MKNYYLYLIIFISLILNLACSEENITPEIQDIPYSQIPDHTYIIDIEEWDIPNDGTMPEKTTDNLQAAIDWAVGEGYGIIYLPAGHYLVGKEGNSIYRAGINLHSNMAFILDSNAIIEMAVNDKWNYSVLSVDQKQYVFISGGQILGDRDGHIYTGGGAHDEGHLITISSSKDVTVENINLSKATGDGILVVYYPENVIIRKNNIHNNRRQGVSIVGGINILIEENEIHHMQGTSPQFGIDIEGAGTYPNEDITISTNHFHHNHGGDIVNCDGTNVMIEGNILEQGEGSTYIEGPLVYWKNSDQTIRNNQITMLSQSANFWHGIIMYSNNNPKTNPAITYIYGNTLNTCGMYMYNGADLEIKENSFINGCVIFNDMSNLIITKNTFEGNSPLYGRFLFFKNVTGQASGNMVSSEEVEIPLDSSLPYSNYENL